MKNCIYLILISCLIACDSNSKTQEINFLKTQEFNRSNSDQISFIKTRDRDIVTHLYIQALEMDPDLKKLTSKITDISQMNSDSIADYAEYLNYNQMYYSSAINIANSIQDTIKRNIILSLLSESKMHDQLLMENHNMQSILNEDLAYQLSDQLKLMKIIISENMMKEYQENKPNIDPLVSLNEKYKELIFETEKYTKINK